MHMLCEFRALEYCGWVGRWVDEADELDLHNDKRIIFKILFDSNWNIKNFQL